MPALLAQVQRGAQQNWSAVPLQVLATRAAESRSAIAAAAAVLPDSLAARASPAWIED